MLRVNRFHGCTVDMLCSQSVDKAIKSIRDSVDKLPKGLWLYGCTFAMLGSQLVNKFCVCTVDMLGSESVNRLMSQSAIWSTSFVAVQFDILGRRSGTQSTSCHKFCGCTVDIFGQTVRDQSTSCHK